MKRDIVIIGGGPAGLAAALEAAKAGAKVLVIDENRRPGGQLLKQIHKFFGSREHGAGIRGIDIGARLLAEAEGLGVEVWLDSAAIGLFEGNQVAVLRGGRIVAVEGGKVLIATGACENAISFSGWTLPGVMGAGAAQTMINVNHVLPGKRILMIGSGNVGVIVSYQLLQARAEVVGIVEAMPKIGAYGVHAAKVRRAGVPFYLGHTIVSAEGEDQVRRATIAEIDSRFIPLPGTEKSFDVDVVCLAAGLRPLTELAWMRGAKHEFIPELGGYVPLHDSNMETSVPGIYIAGDTAGVEEANTAMDEGRLAGVAMAQSMDLIPDAVAEDMKKEIISRLHSLRLGPFGEKRVGAKARVVESAAKVWAAGGGANA